MSTFDDDLPAFVAGPPPLAAADLQLLSDALAALIGEWNDFSGSVNWTSAGTAPVLGNGSVVARYIKAGKLLIYRGRITMGSSTSFGSGNAWSIDLPATLHASAGLAGAAAVFDSSTTANKTPASVVPSGGSATFVGFTPNSGTPTGGPFSQNTPIPWASGDHFDWLVVGEIA